MMYISDCVLGNWELKNPCIEERLKDEPERPVYKIKTDSGSYILKGFSGEMPETTIAGNVRAHLFLGNEKGLAPRIIPTKSGKYYIRQNEYWFYLMEFIEGRQMQETPDDEFLLGKAARQLHELNGYSEKSPFSQSKKQFYEWFRDRDFVKEFDGILDNIADFEQLDQCFVHTDLGPHNAMVNKDGKVIFIDLAESFIRGYYGEAGLTRDEYDLLFYGAEQMHISYMQTYGPYAVDSLWKILNFGMDQKEALWEMINR